MLTTVLQVVTGGRGNPHWEEELFLGGDGHSGGNKGNIFTAVVEVGSSCR